MQTFSKSLFIVPNVSGRVVGMKASFTIELHGLFTLSAIIQSTNRTRPSPCLNGIESSAALEKSDLVQARRKKLKTSPAPDITAELGVVVIDSCTRRETSIASPQSCYYGPRSSDFTDERNISPGSANIELGLDSHLEDIMFIPWDSAGHRKRKRISESDDFEWDEENYNNARSQPHCSTSASESSAPLLVDAEDIPVDPRLLELD